ncbi:MAG: PAS domain S-box protein [Ignavibacteriales bacterium]|nr:PAS domain S-box protein [Ignavibacteriales bacterium]
MKTLWEQLRTVLRTPGTWNNEQQQRRAEILHVCFLCVFVAVFFYLVAPASIIAGQNIFIASAMLCTVIGMFLLRHGHLNLSSILTASTLWLIFTVGTFTEGGITSGSFAGNVALVVFAGLVLGLRGAITVTVSSLLAGGLIVYLSLHNLLPAPAVTYSQVNVFADFSIYLSITAAFTGIAVNRIDTSAGRVARELEERKKAEAELRISEERLRDIIFSSADWVWEVDQNGVYTYSSQKGFDLFGPSRENVIGKTLFDFMPPDEAKRVASIFSDIAAHKAPIKDLENWNVGTKGERICLVTNGVPIVDIDGNLKGYRGVDKDITERKRVEGALAKTTDELKRTLDLVPDMICTASPDGHFLNVNRAFVKTLGFSQEQLLATSYVDLMHPDDRESTMVEVERQLAGQSTVNFENRYRCKDGTYKVLEWHAAPADDGVLFAVARDITERKRAEEKIHLLAHTIKSVSECVTVTDTEGRLIFVNDSFLESYGYQESEVLGKTIQFLRPSDGAPTAADIHEATLARGWQGELMNRRKDGNEFPVYLSSSVVKDNDENVIGMVGIALDITERKRTEDNLKRALEWQDAIFEGSRDSVFISDQDSRFVAVNKAASDLTGYSREQLLTMRIADLHEDPDLDAYKTFHQRIFAGEEIVSGAKILRTEGIKIDTEFSNKCISIDGKLYMHTSARDITERRRTEDALRVSEARFKTLSQLSSDFSYSCVHSGEKSYWVDWITDAFYSITGYNEKELREQKCWLFTAHEGDRQTIIDQFNGLHEGESLNQEFRIVAKDGRVLWISNKMKCVSDPSVAGKLRIFGSVQNITERKQAERLIEEERNLLRSIIDAIPDEIVVKDLERRFVLANKGCLLALGKHTMDEVVGLRDEDLVPERFVSDAREKDIRVLTSGEALVNDLPELKRDEATGELVRAFLSTKTPLRDSDDRVFGLIVVNRDITQLHRVLENLSQSEARFRTVWEHALDGMRLTDAEGNIVMVNQSFCQLFKKGSEELVGRSLAETYLPILNEKIVEQYREAFRDRTIASFLEAEVTIWSGDQLFLEMSNAVLSIPGHPELLLSVFRDITEHQRAEVALRASQEQFRIAQDMSPDGFTILQPVLDAQGRVVDFTWIYENAAVARLNGTDPQAVVGKRLLELFPGHRGTPILRTYQQVAESRETRIFEADYSGESMPTPTSFRIVVVPMAGNIAILAQDITERKLATDAMRESEERYRDLVENSLDLICIHDLEGNLLSVNPAATRLSGFTEEEMVGKNLLKFLAPEGRRMFKGYLARMRATGSASGLLPVITKSGEKRIWEYFNTLRTVGVTVPTVRGLARDITERKQAEENLRESEAKFRGLFEWMGGGIQLCEMVFDAEGRPVDNIILDVNPAYEKHSGLRREQVVGKRIREILPIVEQAWLDRYGKLVRTREPIHFEEYNASLHRWFDVYASALGGNRFAAFFSDITDRKLGEERLKLSREQLHLLAGHLQSVREEERKHLAQEFHDQLGQALTAIKMDLSMLNRAITDTSKVPSRSVIAQGIESSQDMIDRAIAIIREILSELRPELLDQLGIIPTLEWEAEIFQRKSGIACTFSSTVDPIALEATKAIAVYRIFQEAITNVARHAKATSVEVELRKEGGGLVLAIVDNGIGISSAAQQRIQSFGLTGMRERAILLGGTLEISGIEGKGTTILLRIPYEQSLTNGSVAL